MASFLNSSWPVVVVVSRAFTRYFFFSEKSFYKIIFTFHTLTAFRSCWSLPYQSVEVLTTEKKVPIPRKVTRPAQDEDENDVSDDNPLVFLPEVRLVCRKHVSWREVEQVKSGEKMHQHLLAWYVCVCVRALLRFQRMFV